MDDIRDFYSKPKFNSKYDDSKIVLESDLDVFLQKIQICLFTNKGELMSDLNFGCNLEYYLWETKVDSNKITTIIQNEFDTYIPDWKNYITSISSYISNGTRQDILTIEILVNGTSFQFQIK